MYSLVNGDPTSDVFVWQYSERINKFGFMNYCIVVADKKWTGGHTNL